MDWSPQKPYNELPLIPPPIELETKEILKRSTEAQVALESLRSTLELLPNKALFLNVISALEAQSSCAIEDIVASTDSIFKCLANPSEADLSTKNVLRLRSSILEGEQSLLQKPLSLQTAVMVCSVLRGIETDIRGVFGICIKDPTTEKIIYTPPDHNETLYEKISNWENFVNYRLDIDPLVAMAIAHYQFEAMHPFTDGNGRTGRVLNLLYLIQRGLLDEPVLLLSKYIYEHRDLYYKRLLGVTQTEDWIPWIIFMVEAIRVSSIQTQVQVLALHHIVENIGQGSSFAPLINDLNSLETLI